MGAAPFAERGRTAGNDLGAEAFGSLDSGPDQTLGRLDVC
jgi:hypothetical protein